MTDGEFLTQTIIERMDLIFRRNNNVNNFMSCHRFNLTCCREITHFPVTQSIVYTTIYFQSTAALRTAFSMFLSYIV